MYKVFGQMDTEELNACAKGLREEGDNDRIRLLAKENGIPDFFADMFIETGEEFTDPMTAAMGKLDIEAAEYKNNQIPVEPIIDFLKAECTNEDFAMRVRHRTKSVQECMKKIEDNCKKIQKDTGKHYVADMVVFNWAKDYFKEA